VQVPKTHNRKPPQAICQTPTIVPEKLTQKVGFLLFFAEKCKKYTKNAKKTRKNLRISNKSCTFAPSNKNKQPKDGAATRNSGIKL
jgi:hypothetical protein